MSGHGALASKGAATAPAPAAGERGDWVLIVVPAGHRHVRRLRLSPAVRRRAAFGGLVLLALLQWGLVEVAALRARAGRLPAVAAKLARAQRRLAGIEGELRELDGQLQRMEAITARVQAITQLNDPERNLRLGPLQDATGRPAPVLYAQGERIDAEDELLDGRAGLLVLDHALAHRQQAANALEIRQSSVLGFLAGREGLLRQTPSIYPTASRVIISGFGPRTDLFTGHPVVHKGVDILADVGSAVWAPADGKVTYVGRRGEGYGDVVVLDHGFGVQTHYGHLGRICAAIGDSVPRGHAFAEVGRSGRTAGAVLHYEVRFNGIPEDPRRFLLDDGQ